MKKFTQILFIFLFATGYSFAQQEKGIFSEENWLDNWTDFAPNQNDYGEPTKILTGSITEDTKLVKREVYLLLGHVFVTNNATLTIEPGTVILGDSETKGSLTISRGSSIMAVGTETDPIIFSSNRSFKRPGDWGGLIVLGDAPINRHGSSSASLFFKKMSANAYVNTNYGGDNANSSSGSILFTRIEYAGNRVSEDTYFSGLLLASVGKETKLSRIMISHSAGNGIEVWGGDLKLKKAVSYNSHGTDFKFNFGTRSTIINSLAVRSPYASRGEGAPQ